MGNQHKEKFKEPVLLDVGGVFATAVAIFGPDLLWENNRLLSALFILICTLVGVGMIAADWKHLQGLDEMHRKIKMDAMAIALGVGIVGGLSISMLETEKVIAFDAEISYMVILIGVTYLIAIFIGHFKYK